MKVPMNVRTCLACLSLVAASPSILIADDRIVELLSSAVKERSEVAAERRLAITRVIDAAFRPVAAMSASRERQLLEDFRIFAEDRLWENSMSGDDEFSLAIDTARWSVENAARMPAPTDGDEEIADRAVAALEDAMDVVIGEAYRDVPAAAREKLLRDSVERIRRCRGTLANVFYPELLEPKVDRFDREEVVADLLGRPGLQGARERWSPMAEILASTKITAESKDVQVEFFVERESLAIANAATDVLRTWFVMPRAAIEAYENIPAELLSRHAQQRATFEAELRKQRERQQAEQDAASKRREGRKLLEDAGVTTPGGRPMPPTPPSRR